MASNELARRKLTETRLELQAAELRRANAELEQFAYVASHDMREPLRAISGFAQILKQKQAEGLGDEDGRILDRIVAGAKRMSAIIDDMMVLSNIGSQKKKFKRNELAKPLKAAIENLSVVINERQALVEYDSLPTLLLDSSQMALLFQNLIGNAIKFCPARRPEVLVSASLSPDSQWVITVRDNGIGIDPKYFDRIFGIFQRLHSREEYPGTGIGLAICRKIVERHGGRIWLDSEPGVGTAFHFTLTDRPDSN